MYGKSNMETYITVCKIDSQREFAVHLRKLKEGLCINLESGIGREMGGMFKRVGIYVYLRLIHRFDMKFDMTLTLLKSHLFCRLSLSLGLGEIFSLECSSALLERILQKHLRCAFLSSSSQQYMELIHTTDDVNLDHLIKMASSKILYS